MTANTLYKPDPENPREIVENVAEGDDPPIPKPTNKQMKSMDMWVHHGVTLLKQGRLTHKAPKPGPGQEEMDPEDLMKLEVAKDPWDPRLKPITLDQQTRGKMPAWVIRAYNVESDYVNAKSGAQTENYGCVVVKSMLWPGSFNFYTNGRVQQLYCGDGLKHENFGVTYYPTQPPTMMSDKVERPCYDEPNPTEAYLKAKAEIEAKKAAQAEAAQEGA